MRDGERRGVADGGARVPEILTAAELEGFVAGGLHDGTLGRSGSSRLGPIRGSKWQRVV